MVKQTALAKRASLATELATKSIDIEAILLKAAEGNMSLEGIERLMTLRKDLKAEMAREAFFLALSAFQAECPAIEKTRHVYEKDMPKTPENIRYSFAALEDIETEIAPYCKKFGFSYTFKRRVDTTVKEVQTYCLVHHQGGHTTPLEEAGTFTAPIDPKAYMSETQKYGSAGSFSKRYALVDAFGIKLVGEDDDGEQGYDPARETLKDEQSRERVRRGGEQERQRQRPRSTREAQPNLNGDPAPAATSSTASAASASRAPVETTQQYINAQQIGVLQANMNRKGLTLAHLRSHFGEFARLQDIPLARVNEVLAWIREQ